MAHFPPLAIATSSLRPFPASTQQPHDLNSKLHAIAHAGFGAIELAFPDLQAFATQQSGRSVGSSDWDELCVAAKAVRQECSSLGIQLMMLQPFANFEGWNVDNEEGKEKRKDAFHRAVGWIRIMEELGTDMLQVGSTDSQNIKLDKHVLAADLAELADLLSKHELRLAYENWCWATAAPTWRDVYDLLVLVDRPNVGLCLDTFQTAGGEWGDPTTATGRIDDLPEAELNKKLHESLESLATALPAEKIYLLQVSDACKPPKPLGPQPDENGLRPRGRWSSAYRPMPGSDEGYLPVLEVARAVKKTGFRGWFSVEIFDEKVDRDGAQIMDLIQQAEEIMHLTCKFMAKVMEER